MISLYAIHLAFRLCSGANGVPDSLTVFDASTDRILPWNSVAKGMMIGGALTGIVIGPVAWTVTAMDAGKNDWDCSVDGDASACGRATEPAPDWPKTLIPVGIGILATGFVLHLLTIDDARDHMDVFAMPRADGFQAALSLRF